MNKERTLSVAVIGAGMMGKNHLRVYDMLKNVHLAGLFDTDANNAAALSSLYGCRAFSNLDELIDSVDAVSICSPSVTHAQIGEKLLAAGIHCLIEKPLATSEEDCQRLIQNARDNHAKLLVGHIERFNPAVQQAAAMLRDNQTIRAIDARRLSYVDPARITDVDVVADLMVHDLDIVNYLINSPVTKISAEGIVSPGLASCSHVNGLLKFNSGAVASLTASRITRNKVRKLSITTDAGLIDIDYINQSVEVYHDESIKASDEDSKRFGDFTMDIAMERVLVRRSEPLQIELAHFIDIILNDGEPQVSGEMGLSALKLVRAIQSKIES